MTGEVVALPEQDEAQRKRRMLTLGGSGLILSAVLVTGCSSNSGGKSNESQPQSSSTGIPLPSNSAPRDIGKKMLVPNSRHTEIVEFKVPYFIKWYNVESPEGKIPVDTRIVVDCVERGSGMASAPDMYHIVGPDKYATLFAAANDFWNQPNPHPPDLDHKVDSAVPNCH